MAQSFLYCLISIAPTVWESDHLFSWNSFQSFRHSCCLSLSTKTFNQENDTLFSWNTRQCSSTDRGHGSLQAVTRQLTFQRNSVGQKCTLENNIHGKTTFTSFLPRSSQIIGSDEESIENSEFSWEKKKTFKQHTNKPLKCTYSKEEHKILGNHHGV